MHEDDRNLLIGIAVAILTLAWLCTHSSSTRDKDRAAALASDRAIADSARIMKEFNEAEAKRKRDAPWPR